MPNYKYKAIKQGRTTVEGEVTASDLKDARNIIRKMGLVPTNISETTDLTLKKTKLTPLSLSEKIDFISTLQILLSSGIPAVESLMFMEQEASRKKIRTTSGILKMQIMSGSTFADTLGRYPDVFGYIFIGLAKAGEESGELEKTLGRINELLKKQADIKSKVIGTLMYPMFVIVLAFIITIIMLTFVFPAFKDMFDQLDKELPLVTQIMINAGDFLKVYWYSIPLFIAAFVAFIVLCNRWKPAKEICDKLVLKIPLFNSLIMYANYSNFMSIFNVSYDAGIPVVDCLHLAVVSLTNTVLREKISGAIIKVQQGLQVSLAFKTTKVMPKMLLFMIATGEQSGRLGDMLERAVIFLDKTLDGVIDTMTKMIEPVMLIVIGSIVLVMALALYLPLFQSYMS